MYKLIVSDVDGTLVPEGNSEVDPALFEYILKLKENGIRFAAASGRQYESIRYAFEPLRDDIFFIADNGAFVYEKDRMLSSSTFAVDTYFRIARYLMGFDDLYLMVSCLEGSFVNTEDPEFIEKIEKGYGLHLEYMKDLTEKELHVSKIGVYCTKPNILEHASEGRSLFGSQANIYISGEHWIDYLPDTVNKGAGTAWLQQHLGIDKSETIVFGDQNNDISMFSRADISYAVKNAKPDVKEAADCVMDEGPEEAGVLHVLQRLFKSIV